MAKPIIPTKLETADVTIKYGTPLATKLDGKSIAVYALLIHLDCVENCWKVNGIKASAARALSRKQGIRKATYMVEGFDITPSIQKEIDKAVRQVEEDSAKRQQG